VTPSLDETTRSDEAVGESSSSRGLRIAQGGLAWVESVFVDPVRHGRLRRVDWPHGLDLIVTMALTCWVMALGVVAGAAWWRGRAPLRNVYAGTSDTLPADALWMPLALLVIAVSLAFAGALHAPAWVRVVALALVGLLEMSLASTHQSALDARPTYVVCAVAWSALVLLTAVRWRQSFHWLELPTVLLLLVVGVCTPLAAISRDPIYAQNGVPLTAFSTVVAGCFLIVAPLLVVAGTAVAEVTFRASTHAVTVVRRLARPRAMLVVLSLVVVARGIDLVVRGLNPADATHIVARYLVTGAVVIATLGLWWLLDRSADRTVPGYLRAHAYVDSLPRVSLPVGAALVIDIVILAPVSLATRLQQRGVDVSWLDAITRLISSATTRNLLWLATGLVLVALALVLARRGERGRPMLLGTIGLVLISHLVPFLTRGRIIASWTPDTLNSVATSICLAATAWYAVRRRLTPQRAAGLTTALLLSALLAHRDEIVDPLGRLFGQGATIALLLGLGWALLTESGAANEDSPRFPRPTRVLFVLGYSLFAVTSIGFVALTGHSPSLSFLDPELVSRIGDYVIGTALLVGMFATILWDVLFDRDLGTGTEDGDLVADD
jgi:hypothetical protein